MQKGPNPTWGINSETFTIRKVISPHMALLRLAVYEENSNKPIGQRSFPIEDLRAGYRHIPLLSTSSLPHRMSQVFIKVDMATFVYDEHLAFMDILQNPTKHLSRAEQRRQKLIKIGVEGDDIIDQAVEDSEFTNKKGKVHQKPGAKQPVIDPKVEFEKLGFRNIERDTWLVSKLKSLQSDHAKKFKALQKAQDSKYSKEEKRNKSRLAKLQGGSQERLNEFLESREKMKQILDTQLQQKRKEMLQKFESERLKLMTGKLKKKQDEDRKLMTKSHQDRKNNMYKDQTTKNIEDTRKIQAENKDKINKKELERMQREKTAQNGNVFARQHEEMDKQLDKEKKLLTDLHESDQKIMDEIVERERDLFLAEFGQSSDFKSPDSKISS